MWRKSGGLSALAEGGQAKHLKIGNNAIITDKLSIDRGYTSHEHFAEVGLIHMNGRLYDPLLRRFLNADETEERGSPKPLKIINKD